MIGTRLGVYEITGRLGAGGMGEVYRAVDSRLKREVALKVLPAVFTADRERLARFEREAQLLAQLQHPNIASVYGLEEQDGLRALVMELVEGEDLSQVITRGPLPLDEALGVARQIGEALEAAHAQGIVHRDLKPANVKVRADGTVKVLDFGLAKAMEAAPSSAGSALNSPALMNSPTLTSAGTQLGVILGTAAYMSPEQAKGRGADRRSDVWAFGCVLFEMLAGRRAFDGEDTTEMLAAVVRGEPDWRALPADLPPGIRLLVERCLVKDRARRLPDMSVAGFLIAEQAALAGSAPVATPVAAPTRRGRSSALQAIAVAAAAVVLTLGAVWLLRPPTSHTGVAGRQHLAVILPEGDVIGAPEMQPLALSADGTRLAYVGKRQGKDQLFLRRLDDPQPRLLEGTEGARSPFFSPDGEWVAFAAGSKLKRVSASGAALQVLADAPDMRGGSWSTDGYLYFAPTNISGIWRVAEGGGTPSQVTRLDHDQGEISHRWPQILPDNRTLLFDAWTGPGDDESAIVTQTLGSAERRVLVRGGNSPHYLARTGTLVYGRLDGLFAVPWRPSQAGIGNAVPQPLAEHASTEGEGATDFVLNDGGTLVFLPGSAAHYAQRVVWVDRSGKVEPLPLPERNYQSAMLSPDGTQALLQIQGSTVGLWTLDLARGTVSPFTTPGGSSQSPVWTPDGQRVIYRGTRTGTRNLYWKAADGTGEEERLTRKADVTQTPTSISPDGRFVAYGEQGSEKRESRIWLLPLTGDRVPRPLHATAAEPEKNAQFSPDGRWLAFEAQTSGRFDIFVEPFPGPGPRRQVSSEGGIQAHWSADGRELVYDNGDTTMVVDLHAGATLEAGVPRVLYPGHFRPGINWNTPYSIGRDGRFLRVQLAQPERPLDSIDVVLNATGEVDQLLAGKER